MMTFVTNFLLCFTLSEFCKNRPAFSPFCLLSTVAEMDMGQYFHNPNQPNCWK